jgi:TyrR family helix-turn-helix protein
MESEFFGYEKGAFTGASEQGKKGFFELANEGTLFLDEIGELSIPMQSKLLRALQEKEIMRVGGNTVFPINVRIISATNVNLRKAIEEGKFREDLYYRLNIIPIDIPPLRTRKSDINRLAQYFVNKFNKEYKMSKEMAYDAIESLEEYDWPGNVRELKNVIERIIVGYDGSKITKFQVQRHLYNNMYDEEQWSDQFAGTLDEIMNEYERKILSIMIGKYHNASEVARQLQVNKSTISRKLKKYNISR